jgi:phenylacetate-CoA ligase
MGITTTEQACSTVDDRLSPSHFSELLLKQFEALPLDQAGLQVFQKPLEALKNMLPLMATDAGVLSSHLQKQLQALLAHARETCPFYRTEAYALLEQANDPIAALRQLPILRKQHLKDHYTDIWSDSFGQDDLEFWQTSGSTGEPTRFIVDRFSVLAREISFWFSLHLAGQGEVAVPSGKILRLRLSSAEGLTRWYRSLPFENNSLLVKLPAFEHPDCGLAEVVTLLEQEQPPFLAGDPQALITLMRHWQQTVSPDVRFPYILKEVACGGTVLSTEVREQLETFFQVPVKDCYAMSETGIIASECAFGVRHVHTPFNLLEVVDASGNLLPDGQLGELVVTSLMNFGFPLIRYQTGDMGRLDGRSKCPCGSALPILYDFQGRKRRFFIKNDGSLFSPNALVPLMMALEVMQYQLIQDAPDAYRLRYRASIALPETQTETLRSSLAKLAGTSVSLAVELCEQLEEPGVKYQDFISYCHRNA